MPLEIELKLEDLAKIALGSPQLTNVNITVLHSLLEILMKKLNCQNEKVSLSSYECKSLQKMLEKSHISPFAFNDENIELISKKLERVENLEEQIDKLDSKLTCHLKEIENSKKPNNDIKIDWHKWNEFGCEDYCSTCDPENEVACSLLKNTDFLKKLLRRISAPMVDRIFMLEKKITHLHDELQKFLQFVEEELMKIELLQTCIEEIEFLRVKVNENHVQFLSTMEEVQDMLDSKLDKLHIPALKKYIRERFTRIEENIGALHKQKQCPRAAGVIMDGLCCLSCGSNTVCTEVTTESTALLPDVKQKSQKDIHNVCMEKQVICKATNNETAQTFHSNMMNTGSQKTVRHTPKMKCQGNFEEIEFLEGDNGNLYRKG